MMLKSMRLWLCAIVLLGAGACQSPTDPDESLDVDDFVDAEAFPDPATAEESSGRTYRVVRGNNRPDEILEYDWRTNFSLTVTINGNANDEDLDLEFPITLSAATVKVQQASGGIVSPPTSGAIEYYESIITQTTGNSFPNASSSVTMYFDVYYDLPSLRREALVTVTLNMVDNEGTGFTKLVELRVAP